MLCPLYMFSLCYVLLQCVVSIHAALFCVPIVCAVCMCIAVECTSAWAMCAPVLCCVCSMYCLSKARCVSSIGIV